MSEQKNKNKKSNAVVNYFKEVKSELKKTVWPTMPQVRNNTIIVLVCVVIVAAIIALLDLVFGLSVGKVVDLAKDDVVIEESTGEEVPGEVDLGEGIEVPVDESAILGDALPGGEIPDVEESGAVTDGE